MILILTLDDEAEAKAAERQVGKHRLFLRLEYDITSCGVVVKLEGEGQLCGFNVVFDLKKKKMSPKKQRHCIILMLCVFVCVIFTSLGWTVVLTTNQRSTPSVCSTSSTL